MSFYNPIQITRIQGAVIYLADGEWIRTDETTIKRLKKMLKLQKMELINGVFCAYSNRRKGGRHKQKED